MAIQLTIAGHLSALSSPYQAWPLEKVCSSQRRRTTGASGHGGKRKSGRKCGYNQHYIRGISSRRFIRKCSKSTRQGSVHNEPTPNKKQKIVPIATITFSDEDSKDVKTPHDDPLVITIKAGNFEVHRFLVNNGSSAKVLFYDAFKKMNISTNRLQKMDTPLYGFSNHPVAVGVAIGTPPTQANCMPDFMVVKVPSAYNAILGRPALNQLQAVVSTYHLKMKFPMGHGIGEVKGDQTTARQCYITSCQSKNKEALIIEDLREDTKIQRGEHVEDLVSIEVYPREENKIVRIGSNLKEDTKLDLVNLLRTYADIFAWTAAGMPGIDPEVISHRPTPLKGFTEPRGIRKIGELPSERHKGRNLRVKAARYALVEGVLYKKSFSLPYLRCLRPSESLYALHEVHEGICGQHLRGMTLAQKILRQGYYWPTMQRNAIEFTGRCDKCQRFTSVAHPQSNGQTENMNRCILQGLKKKLDEAKGAWVDELPKVLWAYRTTPYSVTGETPFLLCYETEGMLPDEI
ncbi:hypothetical protein RJ639_016337 [Escallonia herrerae]|uniref:Integrase zinc-binding domain-containing protein n=1 Tax=Escallonia herrerae TaxID=1293975 RepID=A0AA88VB42_9ASTE|nr:hypothetical protein RJ639_016337 [Escallonia herrerae]